VSDSEPEFYASHTFSGPLTQGDILEDVLCVDGITGPHGVVRRVMVLSQSCEIDKRKTTSVYVGICVQIDSTGSNLIKEIRERKVHSAFYTPTLSGVVAEGFVDLRSVFRVPLVSMTGPFEVREGGNRWLLQSQTRVSCLTLHSTMLLQRSLARFFGYERAEPPRPIG